MDALKTLTARASSPRLTEPAPSRDQLTNLYRAAFRAADHALLRPWRFLEISGDSLHKLGELFIEAKQQDNGPLSENELEKIRRKPLRAPLIVTTIASQKPHPKVPDFEQEFSAAAATQNMINAAFAQGIGAMWRTGSLAYHPHVRQGLGIEGHEKIVGFLYLGTPIGPARPVNIPDVYDHVSEW